MDMDAMEELSAGSNNNIDQTMIMKGKRTKRQRPLSPVGSVMTSSSSSGSGGGGRGGESGCSDDHHYNFSVPYFSEIYSSSITDQEDDDMAANCLILLAQGRFGGGGGRDGRIKQQEDDEEEKIKMEKLDEMVTTTTATATATAAAAAEAAKSGFYVYECKTCNRTFQSFQALGGHRASHKKPKSSTAAEEKKVAGIEEGEIAAEESSDEEEKGKQSTIVARAAPKLNSNPNPNDHYSSQISMDQISFSNKLVSSHGNNNNNNNNNKSSKIHECSICGSEFSSGQALGGHMRRHRNPTTTTTTTKSTVDHHSVKKPSSRSNTIFPLDLNLPAPEDHDHRDLKFQYATNQQPHLVFSAPALVDCHY